MVTDVESRPPEPAYNHLFETFVDPAKSDAEQIDRLIAYALYKRSKREWAMQFRAEQGRAPSVADQSAYLRFWTVSQIESTHQKAQSALVAYAASVIDDARSDILKDALKGSAWKAVGLSVVAAFLYTLILIGLLIVLKFAGVDLLALLINIGPPRP